MVCLRILEKQEKATLKINRRKEIIKVRAEMNKRDTKKTMEKISETRVGSSKE
jgi:hypothetical protein